MATPLDFCRGMLRRLERVFRCYIVCEMKEDYKEGCLRGKKLNYKSVAKEISKPPFFGS